MEKLYTVSKKQDRELTVAQIMINQSWYIINTVEYYTVSWENEKDLRIDMEDILMSGKSRVQKFIYVMLLFIWEKWKYKI